MDLSVCVTIYHIIHWMYNFFILFVSTIRWQYSRPNVIYTYNYAIFALFSFNYYYRLSFSCIIFTWIQSMFVNKNRMFYSDWIVLAYTYTHTQWYHKYLPHNQNDLWLFSNKIPFCRLVSSFKLQVVSQPARFFSVYVIDCR